MSIDLRPMELADDASVTGVVLAAKKDEEARFGYDPEEFTDEQRTRFEAGMRRFVEVDPQGAWVAVDGTEVVAMAEAIRRDRFWGLSMLFVHPRLQGQGIGRRLLDKTLEYAEGAAVRMIMTSEDPRALRRYSRAGLSIHPAVEASGTVDRAKVPPDLPGREGSVDDLDLVEAVDQPLQRSRTEDVAAVLASGGARLEVVDHGGQRGYGIHRDGKVVMLGATGEEAAATVLWRMLAQQDAKTDIWCLTAAQDWAVRVALEAGLSVRGAGPLFISGLERPPGPWIASGWYF